MWRSVRCRAGASRGPAGQQRQPAGRRQAGQQRRRRQQPAPARRPARGPGAARPAARHTSATAAAFSARHREPRPHRGARASTNRRTAAHWRSASSAAVGRRGGSAAAVASAARRAASGRPRAGTGRSCSPRSAQRRAAGRRAPSAGGTAPAGRRRSGAAATTCSKLSRTSRRRLARRCAASSPAGGGPRRPRQPEVLGDGRGDGRRVAHRRRAATSATPCANAARQLGRRPERQPGLADAARAGQRHQAHAVAQHEPAHRLELVLAADQGRRRRREAHAGASVVRAGPAVNGPPGRSRPPRRGSSTSGAPGGRLPACPNRRHLRRRPSRALRHAGERDTPHVPPRYVYGTPHYVKHCAQRTTDAAL